jgi:hypothetical protein
MCAASQERELVVIASFSVQLDTNPTLQQPQKQKLSCQSPRQKKVLPQQPPESEKYTELLKLKQSREFEAIT